MGSAQSGPLQVSFIEECLFQVGLVEECSLQVGLVEVRSLQVRSAQVGLLQRGPTEVAFFQMRFAKVGSLQMCLAQIGSREQNCCGSTLFCRGLIPLFAGEATAQTCQRKGMQVCITQVSSPQVQPPAILLLLGAFRSGTTAIFVCCQEPLNI